VSVNCPSTIATEGLLSAERLSLMPSHAYLVNTARGEIVDQAAFAEILKSGGIAGAGLDVYAIEPLPENHKLRFLPNVLLTPHIGYVTLDNYVKWYNQMAEDLQAFIDGKPIRIL